jgi:hypothetical protein
MRHLKVGSVIVREHLGKVHEVLVVPSGFCCQGQIYSSLSTIAGKITGTRWNGPRFFGLRGGANSALSVRRGTVTWGPAVPAQRPGGHSLAEAPIRNRDDRA